MRNSSYAAVAGLALAAVALAMLVALPSGPSASPADPTTRREATVTPAERQPTRGAVTPTGRKRARIEWRESKAIGLPYAGRLVDAVQLPSEGRHFFTWDPVFHRSPNRPWRRWGTDGLVRSTLRVVRAFAAAHPGAPRVGIGDLSRRHGGDFGPRFGGIGHRSHQNGLDVDVYYPRLDRRERSARSPAQVDRALAQDLVDRFVAAGALRVFVGPDVHLTGPPLIVQPLAHHDNHLHVRLPRSRA
ncbi:MAG: penicillin-insensitive murein endopeptidase [Actinomycetota bacterium]|nr:penicillin-insensitive murein endopeptidase [Actinomycetota bacterium]